MVGIALLLLGLLMLAMLNRSSGGRGFVERLALRVPFFGPAVRWSVLARWCDALRLGIAAGLDLPASIDLSAGAIGSPPMSEDSRILIGAVNRGERLDQIVETARFTLLPPLIPTTLQLGIDRSDLPATAASLATMYSEQAYTRANLLPAVLSPVLMVFVSLCVGLAIFCVLLPEIRVLQALMEMH